MSASGRFLPLTDRQKPPPEGHLGPESVAAKQPFVQAKTSCRLAISPEQGYLFKALVELRSLSGPLRSQDGSY